MLLPEKTMVYAFGADKEEKELFVRQSSTAVGQTVLFDFGIVLTKKKQNIKNKFDNQIT